MKKYVPPLLLIIIAGILPMRLLFGYFSSYQYLLHKREQLANMDTGDINIGITWNLPYYGTSFMQGVNLALEQENEQGFTYTQDNTLIRKKMVLHYFNDEKINNTQITAEIVRDPKIIAVISLLESIEAIASSVSYEQYGILFLSTFASDQGLTNHGFKYVFSTIPIVREYAQALVDFAVLKAYKKIAYLYSREGSGGIDLTINFSALLHDKNIGVVASHSFDPMQEDYRQLIYDLMQHPIDAIVLGAKGESAARMINQLRTMGIDKPIIGSTGLDDTALWELSGKKSNNTFVASAFLDIKVNNDNIMDPIYNDFYKKFHTKYGYYPDYVAKQGYEAVKILAAAIRKSNSIVPINIAGTLKYNFKGEYKNYYFTELGRIVNKKILIKEMKDGKFYNALGAE